MSPLNRELAVRTSVSYLLSVHGIDPGQQRTNDLSAGKLLSITGRQVPLLDCSRIGTILFSRVGAAWEILQWSGHLEQLDGNWPRLSECIQATIGHLGGYSVSLEKWRVEVSVR
jgi:hypothetical protein